MRCRVERSKNQAGVAARSHLAFCVLRAQALALAATGARLVTTALEVDHQVVGIMVLHRWRPLLARRRMLAAALPPFVMLNFPRLTVCIEPQLDTRPSWEGGAEQNDSLAVRLRTESGIGGHAQSEW